jgi:hypothetical protein
LHCIISFDYCTLINDTINQDLRMFPFDVCYELTIFECMMIIIGITIVKIARNLLETINENTDVLRSNAAALLVVAEQNQIGTAIVTKNTAIVTAISSAHVGTNNIIADATVAITKNTAIVAANSSALVGTSNIIADATVTITNNTAIVAANSLALVGTSNIMAENTAATTGLRIVLTAANAIIDDNTDALLGVARNNPVILPVVGDIFPAVSNSIVHLSLSFSSSKVKVYLI